MNVLVPDKYARVSHSLNDRSPKTCANQKPKGLLPAGLALGRSEARKQSHPPGAGTGAEGELAGRRPMAGGPEAKAAGQTRPAILHDIYCLTLCISDSKAAASGFVNNL